MAFCHATALHDSSSIEAALPLSIYSRVLIIQCISEVSYILGLKDIFIYYLTFIWLFYEKNDTKFLYTHESLKTSP